MSTEVKEFIENLDAKLTEISKATNPRETLYEYLESPEGRAMSARLDEEIFGNKQFLELTTRHAKWMI